jgi:membrane protease YdiL (CAAX protease family)
MKLLRQVALFLGAIILGYLVNSIGSLSDFFIFANLKFLPRIPWLIPLTALWLWAFWRYSNGAWWPRSTSEARQMLANAGPVSRETWIWSLIAGALSFVSVLGVGFLTPRFAEIPRDAFKLPIDFAAYPWWMVVSILLCISVVAGVAEEMGYRGYMLSGIQRRFGWIAGTLVTGFIFFMDHHLGHAYATWAFLPFFMIISALHALLVYFSGSIRPSVVLHAVFDFCVIPVQYGLIGTMPVSPIRVTGIDASFIVEVFITVVFGIAAFPAFRKLHSVSRHKKTARTLSK